MRADIRHPRYRAALAVSTGHKEWMAPFRSRHADKNLHRPVSFDFHFVRTEQNRPASTEAPQDRVVVVAEDLRRKPLRHLEAIVIGKTGDGERILHGRPTPAS